jgi:hypothetical protein
LRIVERFIPKNQELTLSYGDAYWVPWKERDSTAASGANSHGAEGMPNPDDTETEDDALGDETEVDELDEDEQELLTRPPPRLAGRKRKRAVIDDEDESGTEGDVAASISLATEALDAMSVDFD